jgi:hypothetical protein
LTPLFTALLHWLHLLLHLMDSFRSTAARRGGSSRTPQHDSAKLVRLGGRSRDGLKRANLDRFGALVAGLGLELDLLTLVE